MLASYVDPGPPPELRLGHLAAPAPAADEVLVRVEAAPLDRVDTFIRRGSHGMTPSRRTVLGRDLCGVVVRVGAAVSDLAVGDRVLALGRESHAELAVAPARLVFPAPADWSAAEAASLPTAGRTAYDAVAGKARVARGSRVLVTAAGGAVGSAAVQLARAAGATVVATVGPDWKVEPARRLGATEVLSHAEPGWARRGREAFGEVDVVVETVGGPVWAEAMDLLAPDGIAVCCGVSAGHRYDLRLGRLMTRGWRVVGIGRPGPAEVREQIAGALAAFRASGERPLVDRVLPLTAAAQAHGLAESSDFFGRVVLDPTVLDPTVPDPTVPDHAEERHG